MDIYNTKPRKIKCVGNDDVWGGGGHPKAAGSEFSQSIKLKVIEGIFK